MLMGVIGLLRFSNESVRTVTVTCGITVRTGWIAHLFLSPVSFSSRKSGCLLNVDDSPDLFSPRELDLKCTFPKILAAEIVKQFFFLNPCCELVATLNSAGWLL